MEKQSESIAMRFQLDGASLVAPVSGGYRTRSPGTLVGAHGLSGAASIFTLETFVRRAGLACFALNLRGQGSDPHVLVVGLFLDLEDISRDVRLCLAPACTAKPKRRFGFVASMGASILAWAWPARVSASRFAGNFRFPVRLHEA
jgi:alpha-beta hydrolase superfamily lysophospholipase